jgi:hypothetical protein
LEPVTFQQFETALAALDVGGGGPDLSGLMPITGGSFTGAVNVLTAGTGAGSMNPVPFSQLNTLLGTYATTAAMNTALNLKANLASPTFTGIPAGPTAAAGTNSTQFATTAFVTAAIAAMPPPTVTGALMLTGGTMTGPINMTGASPAATGNAIGVNNATVNSNPVPLGQLNTMLANYATTAQLSGFATTAQLANYLPLAGGTLTGNGSIAIPGTGGLNFTAAMPTGSTASANRIAMGNGRFLIGPVGVNSSLWIRSGSSTTTANGFFVWPTSTGNNGGVHTMWVDQIASGAQGIQAGGTIVINGGTSIASANAGNGYMIFRETSSNNPIIMYQNSWYWSWMMGVGDLNYVDNAGVRFVISNQTGNVQNFRGQFVGASDDRLKDEITDYRSPLATVCNIVPKRFRRRGNRNWETGFSAQQLQTCLPDAAVPMPTTDDTGPPMLGVNTSAIIAALVNAVKELTARLEKLEA